jgi:parallel beta-helix repeat protein
MLSKSTVYGTALTFLLVCLLALRMNPNLGMSKPVTIIIPDNYQTIQQAINAASPGDTILVRPGVYAENIIVDVDNLTIASTNGPLVTIVDGARATVFSILASSVEIGGFTVFNEFGGIGIDMSSSSNDTLKNNIIAGRNSTSGLGYAGILFDYSNHNSIVNNTVCNYDRGIQTLGGSEYNLIKNNRIQGVYAAVLLMQSSGNQIISNNMTAGSHGMWIGGSSHNKIIGNNISTCGDRSIMLKNAHFNSICRNIISNNYAYGMVMSNADGNRIVENLISNNDQGINCNGEGNCFYRNNMLSNRIQAYSFGGNFWDNGYPGAGNYWSDYSGVDVYGGPYQNETGSDGIGDAPHIITADVDHYPLMNPLALSLPPAPVPLHTLTVDSSPPGVSFAVEDPVSHTTPWSEAFFECSFIDLTMPETHDDGEARYFWDRWNDGETNRSRTVRIDGDANMKAYYSGPRYELAINSSPVTGILFVLNGTQVRTPYSDWLAGGYCVIEMPENFSGFLWSHWLEDGSTNRTKTVTLPGTTYTAIYVIPSVTPVGGYSFSMEYPEWNTLMPHLILATLLTTSLAFIKLKARRLMKT